MSLVLMVTKQQHLPLPPKLLVCSGNSNNYILKSLLDVEILPFSLDTFVSRCLFAKQINK